MIVGNLRHGTVIPYYDAKCNVVEIGAVNMGEIAAVRKRCHKETGSHDSSPCEARVKNTSVFN